MNLTSQGVPEELSQFIIDYIEEVKELLSSDLWENVFLNCSKNEVLIFWLLYRREEVNMTEVADYIHVPLNTATGIINRMEKNGLVITVPPHGCLFHSMLHHIILFSSLYFIFHSHCCVNYL